MKDVEGKKRTWGRAAVVGATAAIVTVLLGAASCQGTAEVPTGEPAPCVSYWSFDGQWRDSDGEVIDEDPCDGVDSDHLKSPKAKPKPVGTPQQVKTAAPAPRITRR